MACVAAELVFAGDRRVWRVAALCGVPLALLICVWCVVPRAYYTGTDSVEALTYIAPAAPGQRLCVPGLRIPAGTSRIEAQLVSRTTARPLLRATLREGGATFAAELPPRTVPPARISAAVFSLPGLRAPHERGGATLCLTAADLVNWGGTPLPAAPPEPPTLGGGPIPARIALWYLPPAGARSSYLARAGAILHRASLFRPGVAGPWLYALILLGVLPALAFASVRCLALASAASTREDGARALDGATPGRRLHGATTARRLGAWVFAIAAVNFACWAFITPSFQSPDEVDHFAYTQSLVERGEMPSRDPGSPLSRWSGAENVALEEMSFFTDHQVGDTKLPWSEAQERSYRAQVAAVRPRGSDGGGNETAATHGPLYYAALAPAYAVASASPYAQLTLMRLTSALIGALAVLCTFLLARELAPGRPWLAVLAALLVAYEPMYGFISGAVNNDVGVNAGGAAVVLLLIRMLRRGLTWRTALLTGALLLALPAVKGTAASLYPVAAVALAATVWRHHLCAWRSAAVGLTALAVGALCARLFTNGVTGLWEPPHGTAASVVAPSGVLGAVLAHPLGYLGYLWELFLPRLSFMAPHFLGVGVPGFTIFVKRGWGAFGWYDVLFPRWVYLAIFAAMVLCAALALVAARVEWRYLRRNLPEAAILLLAPIAVVAGFEAAFYTTGARNFIPEFGRYAFPAIAPLAVLAVAALGGLGRRGALLAGGGVLVAMLALSYSAQLLTLTAFYA